MTIPNLRITLTKDESIDLWYLHLFTRVAIFKQQSTVKNFHCVTFSVWEWSFYYSKCKFSKSTADKIVFTRENLPDFHSERDAKFDKIFKDK